MAKIKKFQATNQLKIIGFEWKPVFQLPRFSTHEMNPGRFPPRGVTPHLLHGCVDITRQGGGPYSFRPSLEIHAVPKAGSRAWSVWQWDAQSLPELLQHRPEVASHQMKTDESSENGVNF